METQKGTDRNKQSVSVSTKWLCHFVEFAFFTASEADGHEKWKGWFRFWPKPPRSTGIAGRYESSQRSMMPLRHLPIWFADSLSDRNKQSVLSCQKSSAMIATHFLIPSTPLSRVRW